MEKGTIIHLICRYLQRDYRRSVFIVIFFADLQVTDMMPPLKKILESEDLGDLTRNATFEFLMRVGYEHYTGQQLTLQ